MRAFFLGWVLVTSVAAGAVAQTLADQFKGLWSGATTVCGVTNISISSVEPDGTVRGSLECTKRNLTLVFGDRIEQNKSMAAKISANTLDIDGANSTGFRLALEGNKLNGMGFEGPVKKAPASFTRK